MLDFLTPVFCLNTIFCFAGIIVCSCRLGTKMSEATTKPSIRLQYVMWLGLETFLLLDRPLDWAHVIVSGVILANFMITLPVWRHGPPPHALKNGLQ